MSLVSKCIGECPYKLLKEEYVEEAVKNRFGNDAQLLTWQVKDFTKKGDNYSSTVTSIQATFEKDGEEKMCSYVIKMNSLHDFGPLEFCIRNLYCREPLTLKHVMCRLNNYLTEHGLNEIKVPKIFAMHLEAGKECVFLNDLRREGFVLFDRTKGMDVKHALLVLQELGRFHASSLLLKDQLENKDLIETFPFLKEEYLDPKIVSKEQRESMNAFFSNQFDGCINILKDVEGHADSGQWLSALKEGAMENYYKILTGGDPQFHVLNHGDCWNNNILFRYDDDGSPNATSLVDIQCCRVGSFSLDLNFFLYGSLTGMTRKHNLELFLESYYKSFSEIMDHFNKDVPFSLEECKKEYRRNLKFGCISACFILPVVLAEGEEIPDMGSNYEEMVDQWSQVLGKVHAKANFRERFVAVLEEMKEYGIISS